MLPARKVCVGTRTAFTFSVILRVAVFFESSSPSSPSVQLSHRLLFQRFNTPNSAGENKQATQSVDHPSTMIANFKFCDEEATTPQSASRTMSFDLDPHQSFETLLLSVRIQSLDKDRNVRSEIEVAEGLESVLPLTSFNASTFANTAHGVQAHLADMV